MKHVLTVTSRSLVDALTEVFDRKGFLKVGQVVFRIVGRRPGPGIENWPCDFDLEDRQEGDLAEAMIVLPVNTQLIDIKPAWNGEGLPPVGTVCERSFLDPELTRWSTATILCHGRNTIYYRDHNGVEWSHYINDLQFRLIRTAEQLAAEQRDRVADEMVRRFSLHTADIPWKDLFLQMYDSGVLKS